MIFRQVTMTEPFALAIVTINKERPTTACKQIKKKKKSNAKPQSCPKYLLNNPYCNPSPTPHLIYQVQ